MPRRRCLVTVLSPINELSSVTVRGSPALTPVCLWTLTHYTPGAQPLTNTSTKGIIFFGLIGSLQTISGPSHFTVNSNDSLSRIVKRMKHYFVVFDFLCWLIIIQWMIKDYRPYSCCTVRIYRGCPLCPRAYTQPPRPYWGRPSDPAPVSVLLPPPLYISSRPLTVEWYLGFYKKNINHLEPILYTILKMVDHIRRYLVALLTEQSQRIDAIYQVLFNLSPWQTAAFYLSLSDLERNILSR